VSAFRLTDEQWELVEEITDVLSVQYFADHSNYAHIFPKLFDEMMLHFSKAETPLISDTIDALQDLLTSLKHVQDDYESSNVVRIAACASVLIVEEYFSLTEECEVYLIVISKLVLSLFSCLI
jgi:hypothetical protein